MTRLRRVSTTVCAIALFGVLALAPAAAFPASASVDDEPSDPVLAHLLAEVPGGVRIGHVGAVWPELDMEYRSEPAAPSAERSALAVGSCATGRICAYRGLSLTGGVLSWGTCGNIPIPSSFVTRSVAHARAAGLVRVRNGTATVATISAGGWADIHTPVNNLACYL